MQFVCLCDHVNKFTKRTGIKIFIITDGNPSVAENELHKSGKRHIFSTTPLKGRDSQNVLRLELELELTQWWWILHHGTVRWDLETGLCADWCNTPWKIILWWYSLCDRHSFCSVHAVLYQMIWEKPVSLTLTEWEKRCATAWQWNKVMLFCATNLRLVYGHNKESNFKYLMCILWKSWCNIYQNLQ